MSVDNGIGDGIFNWKSFHDISKEFWKRFRLWEWLIMTMRLHDECWWKRGWSQRLCRNDMHPWVLKPSQTMKECFLSNHGKFWCIKEQVEGISALAPFTTQHVASVDNGIGDGLVNWNTFHDISRKFCKRFHWWEWQKMTKRLHDECWWKCGWSQSICRVHDMHP